MLSTLKRTIEEHALLTRGDHVLVAVSGGADSMALLEGLHVLSNKGGWNITVAHLHHGIRGREADEDQAFVFNRCKALGIPFRLGRSDVPSYARRHGLSVEMAARNRRRAFLFREARKVRASMVATAHTRDDQAETVLLRLLRGAGPQGLGGMTYKRTEGPHELIKPMLDCTHEQAREFLSGQGLAWREDASNVDRRYLRNRVRHDLLPLLEKEFNPAITEGLFRTAELLRDEDAWMAGEAGSVLKKCREEAYALNVEKLAAHPRALGRRVVLMWLEAEGVSLDHVAFDTVESILQLSLQSRGSKKINLGGGWVVARRYGLLEVHRGEGTPVKIVRQRVHCPGETVVPALGLRLVTSLTRGYERHVPQGIGCFPDRAFLSRTRLGRAGLYLRTVEEGDRFSPMGMRGTKKLQDILVDAKVPRDRRGQTLVLTCRDELVWVPGYTVARDWAVQNHDEPSVSLALERI